MDPYTSYGNAIRLLININKCQTHVSFASSNWEDKNQSVHSPNRVWNHSWGEHRWAHFQNITRMENASSWLLMSSKRWLMRPSCMNSKQKLNTASNWESSFPSCLQAPLVPAQNSCWRRCYSANVKSNDCDAIKERKKTTTVCEKIISQLFQSQLALEDVLSAVSPNHVFLHSK